jgi:predicted DNA-binding transcriptional regulator YafY
MRAARLLELVRILQTRHRATVPELASALGVSVRTIHRDIVMLSSEGVPVYTETGRGGGVRLLPDYRFDASRMLLTDADLMPLLGLSSAFAGMETADALRTAESRLLDALPRRHRERIEASQRRIYLDVTGWWETASSVPLLPQVVAAVFGSRRLRLRYQPTIDATRVVTRTVEPRGLVLAWGMWHLVGTTGRKPPTPYQVSRLHSVVDVGPAAPDADFDLAGYWNSRGGRGTHSGS